MYRKCLKVSNVCEQLSTD